MRIRFWGTRGSIAKPGLSTVRYGGNTSCVEARSASGTLLVLDCGTGAHALGQELVKNPPPSGVGHLLIGHTHWDHIQGFPFFAPLFIPGNEWHVYGPRGVGTSLRESLAGQMQYAYFPVALNELGARIHYHDLVEGTLEIGDIRITTQYLNHPALTLGYRLEADGVTVVYSTDHEPHSAHRAADPPTSFDGEDWRHAHFLASADLVIHDAQYTASEYLAKRGWGHSTVEYATDTALAAEVRRLALFHHDPLRTDDALDRLVVEARERVRRAGGHTEVFAAAEGLVIELARAAAPASFAPTEETALADPALRGSTDGVLLSVEHPGMREILAAAVDDDGLRLIDVEDCGALSSIAHSALPTLILLQPGRRNCDALSLCRALRSNGSPVDAKVPIVFARTEENPAEQRRESDAGVTDWLIFPFSREYARTRIRAWVLREACRWKSAPLPADEERRLHLLRQTGLLDTEAEERFDRFTRITAALFDVPIALISLVDRDRQWFKSRTGLDLEETERDKAFCAHAILGDEVMQVSDAFADQRFADNPLVTGLPRIRFYAGAPLSLEDGSAVGTLCVIDHRARNLDREQLRLLTDLSKLVERELQVSVSAFAETDPPA